MKYKLVLELDDKDWGLINTDWTVSPIAANKERFLEQLKTTIKAPERLFVVYTEDICYGFGRPICTLEVLED